MSPRGRTSPSPRSGASSGRSSPAAPLRPLSAAAPSTVTQSRILKQQQQGGSRRWTTDRASASPQVPSYTPSPSHVQLRRSTVGEVVASPYLASDDDSSEAETVSSDGGESGHTGALPSPRGETLEVLPPPRGSDAVDFYEEESLELSLGAAGSASFSFLASSIAVEEEEHLRASHHPSPSHHPEVTRGTATAEEVAEEPSLHVQSERQSYQQPESPPDTPNASPALKFPASTRPPDVLHQSRAAPRTPPSAGDSPWSGNNSLVAAGGDDSVLFGSVVGVGGPTAEDSVLYGSPIRTRMDPANPVTASRVGMAAAARSGYFSATSPLRLQRSALPPGGALNAASGGYYPEATAVVYSPDR